MNNKYETRGDVTAIILARRDGNYLETLINTSDLKRAQIHTGSWYAKWTPSTNSFYVMGDFWEHNQRKRVMLHRWILEAPQDRHVDHINHDTLDNRRENLRLVTVMENHQNMGVPSDNTSGVRNVYRDKNRNVWVAEIKVYKKKIYLGRYNTLEEAASVVEKARAILMPYSQEALSNMDIKMTLLPHLTRPHKSNKISGYRNVYWNNRKNQWQVRIAHNKKEHTFGYYDDVEEAAKVAEQERIKLKSS